MTKKSFVHLFKKRNKNNKKIAQYIKISKTD